MGISLFPGSGHDLSHNRVVIAPCQFWFKICSVLVKGNLDRLPKSFKMLSVAYATKGIFLYSRDMIRALAPSSIRFVQHLYNQL